MPLINAREADMKVKNLLIDLVRKHPLIYDKSHKDHFRNNIKTDVVCREHDRPPCHIHAYTVYTPIGGKGRCRTSCDLQDHSMQARKSAGEISTLALKPMRKDTRSPKQEQSVALQNGPWSRQKS